jgi:hypothetical protein
MLPEYDGSQFQNQRSYTYNNIKNNNNQPVCEREDAVLRNRGLDVGTPADRIVTPK